jgi:hypothetical protein
LHHLAVLSEGKGKEKLNGEGGLDLYAEEVKE